MQNMRAAKFRAATVYSPFWRLNAIVYKISDSDERMLQKPGDSL